MSAAKPVKEAGLQSRFQSLGEKRLFRKSS
jgi:hypothetical protein